jgi:CRISPR type III-A-associated RAMP protein Csm5
MRIKILSPTNINNGNKLQPIDYLLEKGIFHRIDMVKMIAAFSTKDERNKFLDFIEQTPSGEKPYLGDFNKKLYPYSLYNIEVDSSIGSVKPEITEFCKAGTDFYIPGSSIKGGILSALYWHCLKEKAGEDENLREIIEACLTKNYGFLENIHDKYEKYTRGRKPFDILNKILFDSLLSKEIKDKYYSSGKFNFSRDIKFGQWLQISDTNLFGYSKIYIGKAKVFGTNKRIDIYYEFIRNGTELLFDMRPQNIRSELYNSLPEIIDIFYTKVLEKEKDWCKKNNINVNFNNIENEKFKMKLGQGASSLSMSLLLLAEDMGIKEAYLNYNNVTKYKNEPITKKITVSNGNYFTLGWTKLSSD